MSGTGSTLVLALWYHLRSLVTAGGRGEAGVLTDVVTMGEVGRHHRGAVTRLGVVGDRACKHNITTLRSNTVS